MSSSKNLEFEKTGFLSKSNSAFIEQMYLQYINQDPSLPDSWKNYFDEIGDEVDTIVNEINGPSWSPKKNKISIESLQKISEENGKTNELEIIKSNNKLKIPNLSLETIIGTLNIVQLFKFELIISFSACTFDFP